MTRIAIFGGSFNPATVAHQVVALYVLETQPVDELWFVPAFAHPFGKQLEPYDHRVAMLELAAAALGPRVRVSRAEEELARIPGFVASRTLDLVRFVEGAGELRLVIGADILAETAKWHRWDEVARLAPPIVVSRPGYSGGTGVAIDVSATRVRELLAARDPGVNSLVPATVLGYIAALGLFR